MIYKENVIVVDKLSTNYLFFSLRPYLTPTWDTPVGDIMDHGAVTNIKTNYCTQKVKFIS